MLQSYATPTNSTPAAQTQLKPATNSIPSPKPGLAGGAGTYNVAGGNSPYGIEKSETQKVFDMYAQGGQAKPRASAGGMGTGMGGMPAKRSPEEEQRLLQYYAQPSQPAQPKPRTGLTEEQQRMLNMYAQPRQTPKFNPQEYYSQSELTANPLLYYAPEPIQTVRMNAEANGANPDLLAYLSPEQQAAVYQPEPEEEEAVQDDGYVAKPRNYAQNTQSQSELQQAENTRNQIEEMMRKTYGDNFLEYDVSGLDTYQREAYNQNLNYYNQSLRDYDKFKNAYDTAERNASTDRQQAYINQQLMMKYLPTALKAQGLGGLGVSQSAYTEANNNYSNLITSINSERDRKVQDSLKGYNDVVSTGREKADEAISGAESNWKAGNMNKATADFDNWFENLNTSDTPESILARYKDKLTGESYRELEQMFKKSQDDYAGAVAPSVQTMLEQYQYENESRYGDKYLRADQIKDMREWLDTYKERLSEKTYTELNNKIDGAESDYKDYVKPIEIGESILGKSFKFSMRGEYTDFNEASDSMKITSTTPTDIETIKAKSSFGSGAGGKQDERVNKILTAYENGTLKDGTVVDFNYGIGGSKFVFYGGYFYPVT